MASCQWVHDYQSIFAMSMREADTTLCYYRWIAHLPSLANVDNGMIEPPNCKHNDQVGTSRHYDESRQHQASVCDDTHQEVHILEWSNLLHTIQSHILGLTF